MQNIAKEGIKVLKAAELYTHTHTHTQLRRCLAFLFSAFLFISSAFSATLPNGYTQLEYIELDHAYLDTGVVLNNATVNQNLKLHITTSNVAWTEPGTSNHLMGCSNAASGYRQEIIWAVAGNDTTHLLMVSWFSFWETVDNNTRWWGTAASGQSFDLNTRYRLDIDGLDATVTNVDTNTVIGTHTFTDAPIAMVNDIRLNGLKGANSPYNESYNIARFYDFEIEGVSHMIPAKNPSGVIGMYDIVRNQFYTKSSSGGTITAGPEVPTCPDYANGVPVGYRVLEYIESSGTQYIDTGINADSDLGIDFKYQFTSTTPKQRIGAIFDNAVPVTTGASIYIRHHLNVDKNVGSDDRIDYYIGIFDDNLELLNPIDTNIHTFVLDTVNDRYIVDGNTNTYNADNFDTHLNYWLFMRNSNNSDLYSPSSMRIYYFKMKYDGTLVRNLVPVQRISDNEIGMYDTVNHRFYTNDGTGAFTAGSVIDACEPTTFVCTSDANMNIFGDDMCMIDTPQPTWPYLTAWYNAHKYYIKLSENDYPIHSGSSHKLQIITNSTTYNAHDESVE